MEAGRIRNGETICTGEVIDVAGVGRTNCGVIRPITDVGVREMTNWGRMVRLAEWTDDPAMCRDCKYDVIVLSLT